MESQLLTMMAEERSILQATAKSWWISFVIRFIEKSLSLDDHRQAKEHHENCEDIVQMLLLRKSSFLLFRPGLDYLLRLFPLHLLPQKFVLHLNHLCFFLFFTNLKLFLHHLGTHPVQSFVEVIDFPLKSHLETLIFLAESLTFWLMTFFFWNIRILLAESLFEMSTTFSPLHQLFLSLFLVPDFLLIYSLTLNFPVAKQVDSSFLFSFLQDLLLTILKIQNLFSFLKFLQQIFVRLLKVFSQDSFFF